MTDIMLDIETLGTKPGCIVLSVGACEFDRATGEIKRNFYRLINAEDSEKNGLRAEAGTVLWWLMQNELAQYSITSPTSVPLSVAAHDFCEWFRFEASGETIWAQGADFDFPIWKAALSAVETEVPWNFWNQRDTRTAYDVCGFNPKSVERVGTYHNALDDAKHQVRCLHLALKHGGLVE